MATIYTKVEELEPGWCAVGIENDTRKIDWDSAPLLHYLGDNEWVDENNTPATRLWDSVLDIYIEPGTADAFLKQF